MKQHGKIAALTGGIASGKSTVSKMFQELGTHVIDADIVARQIVEPGQPAWRDIVEYFGKEILQEDRHINRGKLGAIIFNNPEEREQLNRMTHPRVIEQIDRQIQEIHQSQPHRLILVDVPLLIEASMHQEYPIVILVYVPENVQLIRLMERDNISVEEALTKIHSQMPLAGKQKYATHIVSNDETVDKTREQVIAVYRELCNHPIYNT